MWSIRQNGDRWEVVNGAGEVHGEDHGSYAEALAVIASQLEAALAVGNETPATGSTDDGLLPERWVSPISTLSEPTGDGRDFTDCEWTWRDPATSLLPLMLQTSTDYGHFGAVLAGFIETIATGAEGTSGGTNTAGRFYDSEAGRQFRDMLLGGRRFGVSADPGPGTEAEFHCTEFEDDGWCLDGDMVFTAYEVIGLTGTPFPGFATAYIMLGDPAAPAEPDPAEGDEPAAEDEGDEPMAASGSSNEALVRTPGATVVASSTVAELAIPATPPRAWFEIPEPELGQTGMLDVYGIPVQELLVQQEDGNYAVPLTITNDGRVYGHVARWGQCHVGRLDTCVEPPASNRAYADFHVGATGLDDGSQLATGNLVIGMEHPDLALSWVQARDAYAHAGLGWASVRARNGQLGCWVSGALRPDLTAQQVHILRMLSLSGDWRSIDGGPLELIGALAVNVPGFPIAREAIAASGWKRDAIETTGRLAVRLTGAGQTPTAIVASGMVTRCPECTKRAALARTAQRAAETGSDPEVLRMLQILEARTRHLVPEAMAAAGRVIRR